MYPEFVESFNNNLKITYNLRDETQQGIIPVRLSRSRSSRNRGQRLSMIPPPSDEEEGQYSFRTPILLILLGPTLFWYFWYTLQFFLLSFPFFLSHPMSSLHHKRGEIIIIIFRSLTWMISWHSFPFSSKALSLFLSFNFLSLSLFQFSFHFLSIHLRQKEFHSLVVTSRKTGKKRIIFFFCTHMICGSSGRKISSFLFFLSFFFSFLFFSHFLLSLTFISFFPRFLWKFFLRTSLEPERCVICNKTVNVCSIHTSFWSIEKQAKNRSKKF